MGLWSQGAVRCWRVKPCHLWYWLSIGLLVAPATEAQQQKPATGLSPITITRKPGHEDGQAQMLENGKIRKITQHAVAAWRVRGDASALVVVLQPAKGKKAKQYLLRYYDLDSGRRRVLGSVPMSSGSV